MSVPSVGVQLQGRSGLCPGLVASQSCKHESKAGPPLSPHGCGSEVANWRHLAELYIKSIRESSSGPSSVSNAASGISSSSSAGASPPTKTRSPATGCRPKSRILRETTAFHTMLCAAWAYSDRAWCGNWLSASTSAAVSCFASLYVLNHKLHCTCITICIYILFCSIATMWFKWIPGLLVYEFSIFTHFVYKAPRIGHGLWHQADSVPGADLI